MDPHDVQRVRGVLTPLEYKQYRALINESGGRTIVRHDGHTRTVAFIEGLREWDRFVAALESGADEVAAVHAIDTRPTP